jgi:hypothetical protein
VSGEVQSGTYDASPDYYAVHTYTTLHLHQYYYGAIPTVRPEFALTEVYESAYIPLHSTADLQFCAAPPYCTEHTYSTIHTLYSTGPTTGWAGRPTTSFPLLRRTFIFTSCDSLYTVPSSTLVESQPPRPRHLVRFVVLCVSPLISTRGNIKGSNSLDRHRSPCVPPASLRTLCSIRVCRRSD